MLLRKECQQRHDKEANQHFGNKQDLASSPYSCSTLNISAQRSNDSLITAGWIEENRCHLNINTGVSVTIAWPGVTAGLPKRKQNQPHILQMASRILPVLKDALVELTGVECATDFGAHCKDHI
jgi:hypothetical protein